MHLRELKSGINNIEYFKYIPTGFAINDNKKTSSEPNSNNGILESNYLFVEKNEKKSILDNSKTSSSYNCFSSF